jgi:hypothetical protein
LLIDIAAGPDVKIREEARTRDARKIAERNQIESNRVKSNQITGKDATLLQNRGCFPKEQQQQQSTKPPDNADDVSMEILLQIPSDHPRGVDVDTVLSSEFLADVDRFVVFLEKNQPQ